MVRTSHRQQLTATRDKNDVDIRAFSEVYTCVDHGKVGWRAAIVCCGGQGYPHSMRADRKRRFRLFLAEARG